MISFKNLSLIDVLSLSVFLCVLLLTILTFIYPPVTRLDFTVYLMAARHAVMARQLYAGYTDLSFLYPPSALFFFFPFLFISAPLATSLWNSISLIAIIASSCILVAITQKPIRVAFFFLFLSCMLVVEPVRETLLFGQVNCIVLFCVLGAFLCGQKKVLRYYILAGIFLGIAISLKLFPIFLLMYFFSKKQWMTSLVALSCFLFFLIAGALGHSGYILDYISFAHRAISFQGPIAHDQSFSSFFLFAFPHLQNLRLLITILVYFFSIICSYVIKHKLGNTLFSDFFFFSNLLASTILIITPLAWTHHLLFLLPLCFVLFWQAVERRSTYTMALFLLTTSIVFINVEYIFLLVSSLYIPGVSFFYFHGLVGLCVVYVGEAVFLFVVSQHYPIDKVKKSVLY